MASYEDALSAARSLNPKDRLRLVEAVWQDIPEADWPRPSEAWLAEAARRSAAYDEGRMSAAPWPEVRARARRKAGLDG